MSLQRWLVSTAFIVLGAPACSSLHPKLEQPVGLTTVTSASERAPMRQPLPSTSPSEQAEASREEQPLCSHELPSFLFDHDAVVISPVQDAELRRIADCLSTGPLRGDTVIALGHTDERGSRLYNLGLGLDRALEIQAFLVAHGAPATNVIAASSGQLSSPADWPGRRVDLLVMPAPPTGTTTPGPVGPEPPEQR